MYGSAGAATIVQAAEAITEEILNDLVCLSHSQQTLSITDCQARILGLANTSGKIATVATEAGLKAKMVGKIADPLGGLDVETKETPNYGNEPLNLDTGERVYLTTTQMLQKLEYRRVRLMTNNPEMVSLLVRGGHLI